MKLDPKIVEAAGVMSSISDSAHLRARRVLKAASECVPDDIARRALAVFNGAEAAFSLDAMRAALSAGLAKWAEEE